jgi:hypothetical protein
VGFPTEDIMNIVKEYDTKIDSKNRFVLRNPRYKNYHVKELENGQVILEPRVLVHPDEISKKTLNMMDKAIENLKKGKVGKKIDLDSIPDAH